MSLDNNTDQATSMAALEADVADVFGLGAAEPVTPPAAVTPSAPPAESGDAVGEAPPASPVTPPAGDQPPAPAAAPASGEPAPATTPPAATPPPAAPTAAPATPVVDEEALRRQSLEATVEALTAELTALRANPPAAPSGGPAPAASDDALLGAVLPEPAAGETVVPGTTVPAYHLSLPEAVAAAIFDEDPQKAAAGVTHMMNSLATIVHHNVLKQMNQRFAVEQARVAATTTHDTQAEAVKRAREEYYTAFPGHNNENLQPLITAEASKMAQEYPNLKWGQDYINALGARVNARIAALVPGSTPVPAAAPPATPATSIPSGTRESKPTGELSEEELIADTFS